MADIKQDPRNKSDFSSNQGVNPTDSPLTKTGAKDSIGHESNEMKPFFGSVDVGKKGPFGGGNKY